MRIGLISDTHGLLRAEALEYLAGSDFIIHAGDIVGATILDALLKIAPVTAVRGNNDKGAWADTLSQYEVLEVDGVAIYILHDIAELELDPAAAGFRVVVSGHSHRPRVEERGGVLYVNPGSAGPRRFKLPIAAGELRVADGNVEAHLVSFDIPGSPGRRTQWSSEGAGKGRPASAAARRTRSG
jgi:putative phosphoesterase